MFGGGGVARSSAWGDEVSVHTIGPRTRHRLNIFFDLSPKAASRALASQMSCLQAVYPYRAYSLRPFSLSSLYGPMSCSAKSPVMWTGLKYRSARYQGVSRYMVTMDAMASQEDIYVKCYIRLGRNKNC